MACFVRVFFSFLDVGPVRRDHQERGRQGQFTVADTGPGLSAERAIRVFDRFYRSDRARSRVSGGTGLGLSIAAALVAAHGGTITVDTRPGRGTTFAVRLPLADRAVPQPSAPLQPSAPPQPSAALQPATSPWLAPRRVVG